MSQSKKAAKSALIIIIFSLGSKVLGFIREQLIAAKFGSNARTDTFFIALSAVSLFSSMITRSLNTTMIPVLSEVEVKEGKKGKKEHVNNLLNIVILASMIIIIFAWLLSPLLMKILASGFEEDQFEFAVQMMKIGLPIIIFAGVVGVLGGYLQSEMMFTELAASAIPANLTNIFFLLLLSSFFGIKGLMVTSVLAVLSQLIILVPGVKKTGYKYKYILDFKDKYIKKIIYLIPPVLISIGIDDVNSMVDKSLGSRLVEGSISALNYSSKLDSLTTGIFISAIITVIYPMISIEANKESDIEFKKVLLKGINIILLITIPATIGMILLANPIVRVVFERGKFDSTATYMTTGALVFYSVGLVGNSLNTFLIRVYYSLQDTKIPMISSFIAVAINVLLNFILIGSMQHRGLALATSISAIITSIYLLFGLKRKIGSFGFTISMICGLKSLLAASVMGLLIYLLNKNINIGNGTLLELISLLISVGAGALIYFILIHLLKIDEVEWAIKAVKEKLKR